MRFIFLIPVLTFILTGCQGVSPNRLSATTEEKSMQVLKNIRWKRDGLFGSGRTEWLLVSGEYKASFIDSAGVYYLGASPCFYSTIVTDAGPKSGISFACGIYLSNNPSVEAKVFLIEGSAREHKRFSPDGMPIREQSAQGGAVPSIYSMMPGGVVGDSISQEIQGRFIDPVQQPPAGWLIK